MKTLLFSTVIILCLMVNSILCQEEEGSDGFMAQVKNIFKKLFEDFKSIFNDFKQEMKARTTDIQDWTKEKFDSFIRKMKEWVKENPKASQEEMGEMIKYLDKMEMESN